MNDRKEIFKKIYSDYFSKVYAYFSLCFGSLIAEDLAQQTFLKLWKHVLNNPYFQAQNWNAWIFKAAVNIKNDHLRSKNGRPQMYEFSDMIEAVHDRSEEITESVAIRLAFERLSHAERELLVLKRMGLKSEEIGALLSLHGSTVRSRLAVAKEKFQCLLNDCGVNTDG